MSLKRRRLALPEGAAYVGAQRMDELRTHSFIHSFIYPFVPEGLSWSPRCDTNLLEPGPQEHLSIFPQGGHLQGHQPGHPIATGHLLRTAGPPGSEQCADAMSFLLPPWKLSLARKTCQAHSRWLADTSCAHCCEPLYSHQ